MRSFAAIAYNSFREARRHKVTAIIAAFAAALIFASALAMEATVSTLDRVVVDIGLGSLSIMLVLLTVYLSSGMLNKEIERRTIFLIVTKPVPRSTFLLARVTGNMFTLAVLLIIMSAVFFAQLLITRTPFDPIQLVAIVLIWFELLVLSSVGTLMSTFSSPIVTGIVTMGVFFAGHLSQDIYSLGEKAKSPFLRLLAKVTYYVLPNLERLNLRSRATYRLPASPSEILTSMAYAAAYSGCLLCIAMLVFRRRDFK